MHWSRWRVRIAVAATALFSVACSDDAPTGVQFSELARAQHRWQSNGFASGRYQMNQQRICFCGDYMITYTVTVIDGVPTTATTPTGLAVPQSYVANFRSIEQLFADLRTGLETGAVKEVAYDAQTGYPAVISLDPVRNAVDDEVIYRTSNVARIPGV